MTLIYRVPIGAAHSTIGALFDYGSKRDASLKTGLGLGVYELRVVKEIREGLPPSVELFVEVWSK